LFPLLGNGYRLLLHRVVLFIQRNKPASYRMCEFPPTKKSLHRGQLLHILQQLIVMRRLIKEGLCFNEADCSVLLLCRVDRGLVLFVQLWSLSD